MTIQETIQKAIEGGWNITGTFGKLETLQIKSVNQYNLMVELKEKTIIEVDGEEKEVQRTSSCSTNTVFLDPKFWQCLGKAMKWKKLGVDSWLYQWHGLIDHLAEGGTIETYFEKL